MCASQNCSYMVIDIAAHNGYQFQLQFFTDYRHGQYSLQHSLAMHRLTDRSLSLCGVESVDLSGGKARPITYRKTSYGSRLKTLHYTKCLCSSIGNVLFSVYFALASSVVVTF